jgi:hypothetical protein
VDLLPQLLHHLKTLPSEVVEHQSSPPDPWAGYVKCITDIPDCTHLLIVQDDAQPVPGFADAVVRIAEAQPDRPVCLWASAVPASAAGRARRAYGKQVYIPLGPASFVPLVAVLWPVYPVLAFAEWAQTASGLTRADDGNVAKWVRQMPREQKPEFLVTVPSIVEHNDFTPTVKGGDRKESHGRASDRVAQFLAEDASAIRW